MRTISSCCGCKFFLLHRNYFRKFFYFKMWSFNFQFFFNSARLPPLLIEGTCVCQSGWLFSPVGVSEVSSFSSVPLLSCLLDVNSAGETPSACQVHSFHLIKPGLCPLCLHLCVTMSHTVWSSLSSDMRSHETCVKMLHARAIHRYESERKWTKLEASPLWDSCSHRFYHVLA